MSQDGNAKQPAGSAGAVGAGGGIPMEDMPELVIVSGMSGAGRTEAMHVFEDLGYFCVDNLPASLIGNLFELGGMSELPGQPAGECRIAVVCDARNRMFFSGLTDELRELDGRGLEYRILFLDASDEKLIARYKSSRRRHPLCEDGTSIEQGIQRERSLLFGLREMAHHVVDTTDMLPQQLRAAHPRAVRHGAGAPGAGGDGVLVRLQARRAPRRRPGHGRALPAQPLLRPGAAPPDGARRAGARVRGVPRGDHRVREALARAAGLRHAGLRGRGQAAAGHRRGLHGRAAPQRGAGGIHRRVPEGAAATA